MARPTQNWPSQNSASTFLTTLELNSLVPLMVFLVSDDEFRRVKDVYSVHATTPASQQSKGKSTKSGAQKSQTSWKSTFGTSNNAKKKKKLTIEELLEYKAFSERFLDKFHLSRELLGEGFPLIAFLFTI